MAHKKTAIGVGIILFALLVLGGGYFSTLQNVDAPPPAEEGELDEREVDISELTEPEVERNITIDVTAALVERVLGNPDAPIKISEHSSFTCGHCGNFHKETFKAFKENWIDTGRAYLVFSDFPLNAPALHASLVARCVADDDQYFALVEELFEKQDEWAYQSDYFTPLKAILSKYDIASDMFKACIGNEDLQEGLLDKVRAAQAQYGVSSTPSFVINNAVTITGSTSYEKFNEALEGAVEQSKVPPPPSGEEGTP